MSMFIVTFFVWITMSLCARAGLKVKKGVPFRALFILFPYLFSFCIGRPGTFFSLDSPALLSAMKLNYFAQEER